ncbi:MAG: DUF547 domain-containing protein [Rhodocyclaceae bacterium]|nr:DUF547 domain-containing protein [Rhodocyclaceae bacterium]
MKVLLSILLCVTATSALAFDHRHEAWNRLLSAHVRVSADGHASAVDYAGFKRDQEVLAAYLGELSAVSSAQYQDWSRDRRLAFLINAYNAWTVDLVLNNYPGLESIKDLGGLFSSPWQKKFFRLLGKQRSLDDIEHGLIRAPGQFDEPRIHFAVVCASVGCPMLRPEAYVDSRLDTQLEDAMLRFLGDHTRNRYDSRSKSLEVSKIFDWYEDDFATGAGRFKSLRDTFSTFADVIGESPSDAMAIQTGDYRLEFLSYDWSLNDSRR